MDLKVRKLAWVLGGVSLIGVTSLVAVACSTSNGDDDVAPPSPEAGRTDTKPNPTTTGSTPTDGSTPDEDGGAAPDCGFAPRLRSPFPPDAGADASPNFFCPFADGGTGSATDKRYCGGQQTCCSGQSKGGNSFDPSFCTAAKADTCGGGTVTAPVRWECGSPDTCGGGQKCCIPGTDAGPPAVDTEKVNGKLCPPEFQRGFYIGGTVCRTDCASGELQVCTKDADCTGGKKCTAFTTNSRDLGYCK